MLSFLHAKAVPYTVVLTKADKLSRMKLKEHISAIAADLYLGAGNLIATSAETGQGRDDVLKRILSVLVAEGDGAAREDARASEKEEGSD